MNNDYTIFTIQHKNLTIILTIGSYDDNSHYCRYRINNKFLGSPLVNCTYDEAIERFTSKESLDEQVKTYYEILNGTHWFNDVFGY